MLTAVSLKNKSTKFSEYCNNIFRNRSFDTESAYSIFSLCMEVYAILSPNENCRVQSLQYLMRGQSLSLPALQMFVDDYKTREMPDK